MKAKDSAEKEYIKFRFATALDMALTESKLPSVRNLSVQARMEPAHLQRIYNAEVDLSLVTIISVIEGLDISTSSFFAYYDSVTESDIRAFKRKLEKQKKANK